MTVRVLPPPKLAPTARLVNSVICVATPASAYPGKLLPIIVTNDIDKCICVQSSYVTSTVGILGATQLS